MLLLLLVGRTRTSTRGNKRRGGRYCSRQLRRRCHYCCCRLRERSTTAVAALVQASAIVDRSVPPSTSLPVVSYSMSSVLPGCRLTAMFAARPSDPAVLVSVCRSCRSLPTTTTTMRKTKSQSSAIVVEERRAFLE